MQILDKGVTGSNLPSARITPCSLDERPWCLGPVFVVEMKDIGKLLDALGQ